MRYIALLLPLAFMSVATLAADNSVAPGTTLAVKNPFPNYPQPPKTRQENIQRVQQRLEILQKMSDSDWSRWMQQQKFSQWKQQYKQELSKTGGRNLSPAEREQARKNFQK